jgi:hypothetical protein
MGTISLFHLVVYVTETLGGIRGLGEDCLDVACYPPSHPFQLPISED